MKGECHEGGCYDSTPPPFGQQVGGTHPTRMHSCFYEVATGFAETVKCN